MTDSLTVEDYRRMCLIRRAEERVAALRASEEIVGSVHLCNGQEAVAVGATSAMETDDTLVVTYRGHGWAIAKGMDLTQFFGELLGRATGVNGGRAGSAMLSDSSTGFLGENSIVGAGAPIAVGAALAHRQQGNRRCSVVAFGDGAMNQGSLNEALNFAVVFALPIIFVCENNRYSELTPIADMVSDPNLFRRAAAFGMPSRQVDGNDPAAVRHEMTTALQAARGGSGPTFIEAMTQRIVGHYIGDAEIYRPAGELEQDALIEPLVVGRQRLLESGTAESVLDDIEVTVSNEVQRASDDALRAPQADELTVKEHLYA